MFEIRHEQINAAYTTRDAYNDIYSGEGILHRDSMYQWLIRLLHPQPGKTLLDIATGEGRLVTLAQQMGLNAIGTDFAFTGVRHGQSESPRSGWFVADGEQLPIHDHSVDYVTHIGSLEHYEHPALGAAEIARVMKVGGQACILLPNAFGLLGNIKYVVGHGDIFDDGQPLQRYATRAAWGRILTGCGLRIEQVVGYHEVVWPTTPADRRWLARRPQKLLKLLLSRFIPLNLSNHLVYLCRYDGA